MNTKLIILIALVALTTSSNVKDSYIFSKFNQFIKDYNKTYSTMNEYITRYNNFKQNYLNIESKILLNKVSHRVGINKFSDMTFEEFKATYLTLKIDNNNINYNNNEFSLLEDVPDKVDWREKGAVGHVKDQGQCGSCWAFSAVANIEGQYALKTGKLLSLSEQQLVDCDKKDEGCGGGFMFDAFQYIIDNGGIEEDKDYSYKAKDGKCKFNKSKVAVEVESFIHKNDVTNEEYTQLLSTLGPLSVAMNAESLFQYDGGIIDLNEDECDPDGLNHGVTAVGYEKVDGKIILTVKNSWGKGWGEDGFFRININSCGLNKDISSVKLK